MPKLILVSRKAAIARASKQIDRSASIAQREAGNFRMGHVSLHGLDLTIEIPAGGIRKKRDSSGKVWKTKLKHGYGYVKNSIGKDGDHIDVLFGPHVDSAENVYVLNQVDKKTGALDEHKCVVGAHDAAHAEQVWTDNYPNQAGCPVKIGSVACMPVEDFKAWVASGDKSKPATSTVAKAVDKKDKSTIGMDFDAPAGPKQPHEMRLSEYKEHVAKEFREKRLPIVKNELEGAQRALAATPAKHTRIRADLTRDIEKMSKEHASLQTVDHDHLVSHLNRFHGGYRDEGEMNRRTAIRHQGQILTALAQGKPVPAAVLADHPADAFKPETVDWWREKQGLGAKPLQKSVRNRATLVFVGSLAKAADAAFESKHPRAGAGQPVVNPTTGKTIQPGQFAPKQDKLGFFSHAERVIRQKMGRKSPPAALAAMLHGAGVKSEEMQHSGLGAYLNTAGEEGRHVTQEEVLQHLQDNAVHLEDVTKGYHPEKAALDERAHLLLAENNTTLTRQRRAEVTRELDELSRRQESHPVGLSKFDAYQLPGGAHYQEHLLILPVKAGASPAEVAEFEELKSDRVHGRLTPEKIARYNELVEKVYQNGQFGFVSAHWDEPNVVVHYRTNDRTGANGERILHVEEIQSDWGQAARKRGIKGHPVTELPEGAQIIKLQDGRYWVADEDGNDLTRAANGDQSEPFDTPEEARAAGLRAINSGPLQHRYDKRVPDAPFIGSTEGWAGLALRRILRHAAENGYDKVTWTPGADQAARYPEDGGGPKDQARLKGMQGFYDVMVPTYLNHYAKQWGVRVGTTEIPVGTDTAFYATNPEGARIRLGTRRDAEEFADNFFPEESDPLGLAIRDGLVQAPPDVPTTTMKTVPSIDITPAMRRDILEVGQPLHKAVDRSYGMGKGVTLVFIRKAIDKRDNGSTSAMDFGAPPAQNLFGEPDTPEPPAGRKKRVRTLPEVVEDHKNALTNSAATVSYFPMYSRQGNDLYYVHTHRTKETSTSKRSVHPVYFARSTNNRSGVEFHIGRPVSEGHPVAQKVLADHDKTQPDWRARIKPEQTMDYEDEVNSGGGKKGARTHDPYEIPWARVIDGPQRGTTH